MKVSIFLEHLLELAAQKSCASMAALREAKRSGIDYVEVDFARACGREEDLRRLLEAAGLQTGGLYGFFDCAHKDESDAMARFLDCAQKLGAANVMAMPGRFDEGDDEAEGRERMAQALERLCRDAAGRGVTVVLEDCGMPRQPHGTAEQVKWFLDRVPGLACTFDTGNFLYHGEDVLAAYDLLEKYIEHVHMKDLAFAPLRGEKGDDSPSGRRLYPAPVGSGELPMAEIVRRLYERGYEGLYAIEHFGAGDQLLYMRRSARWMNNIFR